MKKLKIQILVNEPPHSAMDERVNILKNTLQKRNAEVFVLHRSSRIKDIFNFLFQIITFRPHIVWIMDVRITGTTAIFLYKLINPKVKVVFDTGDDEYWLSKNKGRNVIICYIIKLMQSLAYKIAAFIIVRGRYHKEYLEKRGIKNVFWIPDGVNTDIFRYSPSIELRKSLGLENAITIGVVGSLNWSKKLNWCYGVEIVEAMRYLKEYPVKGIIIGDGDGLEYLKKLASQYGLSENILFLGRIKLEELPKYINLIDIAVSTQTNDIAGWVRTGAKLPIYLACERYVLCSDVGEAHYILPKEMKIPMRTQLDDDYPLRLAERIRELINNKKGEDLRWEEGRKIAVNFFDYKVISQKFSEVLDKLIIPVMEVRE
jgi:glycosyltransferase involved in cell wall biosynthesis